MRCPSTTSATQAPSFTTCTFKKIGQFLQQSSQFDVWMGLQDAKSAYRHVPIAPRLFRLFWFEYDGAYYCDLCCAFGWRPSGYAWNLVGRVLDWSTNRSSRGGAGPLLEVGRSLSAASSRATDDLFYGAISREACSKIMDLGRATMKVGGITNATEKEILPTQRLIVLGVGIDTRLGFLFVTHEKVTRTLALVQAALSADSISPKGAKSLAAKLAALDHVIIAARFFTHHLALIGRAPSDSHHGATPIPYEARQELRWWAGLFSNHRPGGGSEVQAQPGERDAAFIRYFAPARKAVDLIFACDPTFGWLWGVRDRAQSDVCIGYGRGTWSVAASETYRSTDIFARVLDQLSTNFGHIIGRGETLFVCTFNAAHLRAVLRGTFLPTFRGTPGSNARARHDRIKSRTAISAAHLWSAAARACIHLRVTDAYDFTADVTAIIKGDVTPDGTRYYI